MRLAYEVVDVFTRTPYAGNALAVVFGADALSTAQCQAIAREFNLSETTFPMASDRADYRLRIFTPAAELPFAGHPSIGTAWVQRARGAVVGPDLVQDCGAGLLPLSFRHDGAVELTGGASSVGPPLSVEAADRLLASVGLDSSDRTGTARWASTGSAFTMLPVTPSALVAALPSPAVEDALRGTGGYGLYLFARGEDVTRARMFAPGLGVPEDPATGSAATALGSYLAAEGLVPAGETTYVIRQGGEMGRPSELFASVVVAGGVATRCRVAGHVVPVGSGEITAPAD